MQPLKLGDMQAHAEVGLVAGQWAEVATSVAKVVPTLTNVRRAMLDATILETIIAARQHRSVGCLKGMSLVVVLPQHPNHRYYYTYSVAHHHCIYSGLEAAILSAAQNPFYACSHTIAASSASRLLPHQSHASLNPVAYPHSFPLIFGLA